MSKVANVNTTDVRSAIELGCRTMQRVFNADDNDIPFMGSKVFPVAQFSFNFAHSEAHVPGRHLNALLAAEAVAGVRVDEEAITKHARAAMFSYGGPLPVPLNRQEIGGPLVNFYQHNIREGFHALYALAAFRNDARAAELADASADFILQSWNARGAGWNDAAENAGLRFLDKGEFIAGVARAIGPLVKIHRATGSRKSIELAGALAEHACASAFAPDGAFDSAALGTHAHSIACVMSSLAQLADFRRDRQMMDRVRAFYDNGLWMLRDEIGWAIELLAPHASPDRGEANTTGDMIETALILGRWFADARYFHDAERMLRCHLLPSQLRDTSFITDPPNPQGSDALRDVADRHLGAFGFPAPYGHCAVESPNKVSFNMDIVGGAVASLCDVLREDVALDDVGTLRVNLLFDRETEDVSVQSPYANGHLRVMLKRPVEALAVRVPPWVGRDLAADGFAALRADGYLRIDRPPVGKAITLSFDLPEQEVVLKHRTRNIRARLRGDAPLAMENFGMPLTFFDPLQ